MSKRFEMVKVQPAAYKAMNSLEQYLRTGTITPLEREMINIRASQINGCAYCGMVFSIFRTLGYNYRSFGYTKAIGL